MSPDREFIENIDYMDLILDYHKSMRKYNLNLVYEGEVNQSITKAFTAMAEKNLSEDMEEKSTVRKVYHVMVECLQNVYKQSDDIKMEGKSKKNQGIFLVGQDKSGYVISTGNLIDNSKIDQIKTLLDRLNSMSKEEVDDLYKLQIKDGVLSEKGGAGLGFIDISRKTGSKLEYKFENIDEKASFFILKTYIAK